MAGTTSIISAQMYAGNANQSINITGADGIVVMSYSSVPLTGVAIGGGALSRKWVSGNASVWYKSLNSSAGSAILTITASNEVVYVVASLKNGAGIRFSKSGYGYTPTGGGEIDLDIPTSYTSPGNLCLGMAVSVPSGGTYFYRLGDTLSWSLLPGGLLGEDGRVIRTPYYKTSGGSAEEWHIKHDYGGFYSLTTVIEGYDYSNYSNFSTVTIL